MAYLKQFLLSQLALFKAKLCCFVANLGNTEFTESLSLIRTVVLEDLALQDF